jgi:hypothetical protein
MILMIRDMSRGHACAAGHIAPRQLPAVFPNHEDNSGQSDLGPRTYNKRHQW